jgi:hypothetical protein
MKERNEGETSELEKSQDGESQIRQIAQGASVRAHRYGNRSQPMGQPPVTHSREAIELTSRPPTQEPAVPKKRR